MLSIDLYCPKFAYTKKERRFLNFLVIKAGKSSRSLVYIGYSSRMEERNLSYMNLLGYIHFLTMQNEEIKAIIFNEVENDVTRITYQVITIMQCLHQQRNANGFA